MQTFFEKVLVKKTIRNKGEFLYINNRECVYNNYRYKLVKDEERTLSKNQSSKKP